jgi:aspartyl-tRNA(Asn)/glutamyl-tRNA(Gln) amidotransferase subunit A
MHHSTRREFMAAGAGAVLAARAAFAESTPELAMLSLKEASDRIHSKKVSPVELTEACLARIKTFNPKTNAFISVMREMALKQAKELEKEQMAGKFRGPLHGIPIALKDNIDAFGVRTTAGSKTLEGNFPTEDSEVAARLRAAGAIFIGKTNMHIFAGGATSAVSYFGPVRNPWGLGMIAGGSSGGSAAAVADYDAFGALGTDTGGSVRTPSAMCGVVGFKPTYGRVSIRGIVPLTWSLDHCGPIARRVEDITLMMPIMAGYDKLDLQSVDLPVPDYAKATSMSVAGFHLGVPRQFYDTLGDDVAQAVEDAIEVLNKLTKGSKDVEMPSVLGVGGGSEGNVFREALGAGELAGVAPNGGRGGGGGAADGGGRGGGNQGTAVEYIRQWRSLRTLRRVVNDEVFDKQKVECVLTPTIRHVSWSIEEELTRAADARARNPEPGNTRAFDDYGLPTITVPCGFSKDGLPIGLQISGANWTGEVNALAVAYAYQQATEWHKRPVSITTDSKVPPLSKRAMEQTGIYLTR